MNEKKLAEQLSKGSTEALGKIIDAYSGYVRTVAYNFSKGSLTYEDIEETAIDVFYKLWNAKEKINADIGLRSYLSVITRNAVSDRFKRMPPPCEDISDLEIPSELLVEDIADMNSIIGCLYECLEKLPKDDRQIFFRYYFNGDKASGIADKLGISKGAVDTKLYRIRKKLKAYLSERGYDNA